MKCAIVQDLLSAYCDGACSPETAAAIEEHTAGCPVCSKFLEDCQKEVIVRSEESTPEKPFKKIKRSFFHSKVVIIILAVLLIGILCGVGYLTYGQVVRDSNSPSFETLITSRRAEKLVKTLCEGDIDGTMDHIRICFDLGISADYDEMRDYCAGLLTELYEEELSGRKLKTKVTRQGYSSVTYESMGEVPYAIVSVYEGDRRLISFQLFRYDNWFFRMRTITQTPDGEADGGHTELDFALAPETPYALSEKYELNNSGRKMFLYDFANLYTDDPVEAEALAERTVTLMDGLTCENFIFDNFRFDAGNSRYLADICIILTENDTGKSVVYRRPVRVVESYQKYEVLPEFSPDIIDEGVSEQTREKLENFL